MRQSAFDGLKHDAARPSRLSSRRSRPAFCFFIRRGPAQTPTRLHPVMQDANDLDDARLGLAKKDDMHGLGDQRFAAFIPGVSDMQAADAGEEVAAVLSGKPERISRNPPHRGR